MSASAVRYFPGRPQLGTALHTGDLPEEKGGALIRESNENWPACVAKQEEVNTWRPRQRSKHIRRVGPRGVGGLSWHCELKADSLFALYTHASRVRIRSYAESTGLLGERTQEPLQPAQQEANKSC